MTLETERRKENRKRPPGLVYVELASANGGMMRDIGEEGFAVRAMMPLRIGDSTSFAFSVDASTRYEGSCQVLWVEEEGRVAGLKFIEVSPQLREQVRLWLSEEAPQKKEQPVPPAASERQVNTLEELRDELRGVTPRVEAPRTETPPDEVTEIPRVEIPRVGIPRVEIPPVEIPRAEESVVQQKQEELQEEVSLAEQAVTPPGEISLLEEALAPPASPEHAEVAPEQREEEELEAPAFAQATAPDVTQLPADAPALEPLPEFAEEVRAIEPTGVLEWLDRATVLLAIRILIFLALVAGTVVYHRELGNGLIWLGAKLSGTPAASGSRSPASRAPAQTAPATTLAVPPVDTTQNPSQVEEHKQAGPVPSPTETKKASDTPEGTENSPTAAPKKPNPNTSTPVPATNKPPGQKTPAESNAEAGQQEFLQAQEILKGRGREAGLPEAVRLLWIAVEKGNSSAEVSLAELYHRGEGVTRNCDQTRILLTAAARKGNGEAQKRLDQFLREGCE